MAYEELDQLLQQATEPFIGASQLRAEDIWISHWLGSNNALLAWARGRRYEFDQSIIDSRVRPLLDTSAANIFRTRYPDNNNADRAILQLHGMVHAVLAAQQLAARNDAEFRRYAAEAIEAYQSAWRLDESDWDRQVVAGTRHIQPDSQDANLAWGLCQLAEIKDTQLTNSGVLTLRRLLEFIFLDDEAAPEVFATKVKMLLAPPWSSQPGQTRDLTIGVRADRAMSVYLDPVAFGLTVVDDDLLSSIRVAWKLCETELKSHPSSDGSSLPSVRLAPDTIQVHTLHGDSAGALMACGIFAAAKPKREQLDDGASMTAAIIDDQGTLDPVGSVKEKLEAAHDAGLRRVVLVKDQATDYQAIANKLGIVLQPARTVADAFALITGDSRYERVLERYCAARVTRWKEDRANPQDVDKLRHYIEPHYLWLKEGHESIKSSELQARRGDGDKSDPRSQSYEPVAAPGDSADVELLKLMRGGRLICLTEDAGAGKSIFTRRLQAFLCDSLARIELFNDRPALAVRFEPRRRSWPSNFRESLVAARADELGDHCDATITPADVARWTLSRGRVVLILDALDQVSDPAIISALEEGLTIDSHLRVVMTSRDFAAKERKHTLFNVNGWRFGSIDGFDVFQQYTYLKDLLPAAENESDRDALRRSLEHMFPNYTQVEELLRAPVVLSLIRDLARPGAQLTFRTRGELYTQVHLHLLERAAHKLGLSADCDELTRYTEILTATGFQMMVDGVRGYTVSGTNAVVALRRKASARCRPEVTTAEWKQIEKLSVLTGRLIMEVATLHQSGFKHKGMMEFYAGLHLAINQQTDWVRIDRDTDGQVTNLRCGELDLARHVNDGNWHWAWQFAAELPNNAIVGHEEKLCASLSELFRERPQQRRPSELIYRAWHRFELDLRVLEQMGLSDEAGRLIADSQQLFSKGSEMLLPYADVVIREFRRPLRELLNSANPAAAELLADDSFARCPPTGDQAITWIGATENEEGFPGEFPRHQVRVRPFLLQRHPVTREQFALFDAHWETDYKYWLTEYASDPQCPAIGINWYHAFAFCKWLGREYQLPSDVQWECACRADSEHVYWFGSDKLVLAGHAWIDTNSGMKTHPAGADGHTNPWGLSDMHGNVWEWCWDWLDLHSHSTRWKPGGGVVHEDAGPAAARGWFRTLRGGSYRSDSRFCRSSNRRTLFDPAFLEIGFRLCRRLSSAQWSLD